jgi:hypothetical protein
MKPPELIGQRFWMPIVAAASIRLPGYGKAWCRSLVAMKLATSITVDAMLFN